MRMLTLLLVFLLGIWGFVLGIGVFCVAVATNRTVTGRKYLYPLIPFDFHALTHLLFRRRKVDFDDTDRGKEKKSESEDGEKREN